MGHVNFCVKIEKIRIHVEFICIFLKQPWKDTLGINKWFPMYVCVCVCVCVCVYQNVSSISGELILGGV